MPKVIMLIGIPGSGKTTFANSNDFYEVISMDIIKRSDTKIMEKYNNVDFIPHIARLSSVQMVEMGMMHYMLKHDKNVIIDDMNLSAWKREPFILLAKHFGADISAVYFSNTSAALLRNKKRNDKTQVPENFMEGIIQNMEEPSTSEGFDKITIINH